MEPKVEPNYIGLEILDDDTVVDVEEEGLHIAFVLPQTPPPLFPFKFRFFSPLLLTTAGKPTFCNNLHVSFNPIHSDSIIFNVNKSGSNIHLKFQNIYQITGFDNFGYGCYVKCTACILPE